NRIYRPVQRLSFLESSVSRPVVSIIRLVFHCEPTLFSRERRPGPNPSIERTSPSQLRWLCAAAHVERYASSASIHQAPRTAYARCGPGGRLGHREACARGGAHARWHVLPYCDGVRRQPVRSSGG